MDGDEAGIVEVPLSIGHDALRVEVIRTGASLVGVHVPDRTGRIANVVRRLGDLGAQHDPGANPYLGAVVGRFANRIAGARVTVEGTAYRLEPNEGRNVLHGGPLGWSHRPWRVIGHRPDALTLELDDPEVPGGFPGGVSALARYVVDGDRLSVVIEATADRPTVVAATHHPYWNLAGGGTVDGHVLRLDGTRFAAVDDERIPTGAWQDSPFRAEGGATLQRHDHWFELSPGRPIERVASELMDPASGRTMELWTDQPGIQVYTGDMLGAGLGARGGVCLEPAVRPDTADSCILVPGRRYRWNATHRFGTVP